MFDHFNKLKDDGYYPDAIIDVGAHHGNWTKSMMSIYPNSTYYLFEGIKYNQLDIFQNIPNIHVRNELLNDKKEEVDWYEEKNTGDSFFKERTKYFLETKLFNISRNASCLKNVCISSYVSGIPSIHVIFFFVAQCFLRRSNIILFIRLISSFVICPLYSSSHE